MGDHNQVLDSIADDLTQEFTRKLRALGFKSIEIKRSRHAKKDPEVPKSAFKENVEREVFDIIAEALGEPKRTVAAQTRAIGRIMKLIGEVVSQVEFDKAHETPEGFLPPYIKQDAEIAKAFSELMGPMGRRGVAEVMRDRLVSLLRECVEIHDTVSNNIVKPNPTIIHGFVDQILEAVWAKFELYRKPVRFRTFEHDVPRTSPFEFTDAEKKIGANSEYGKREGVWVDPLPTIKLDKPIFEKSTTIAEVNSFSENPPMIELHSGLAHELQFGNRAKAEETLIVQYLKMFPAPPGMHNCLEVGCKIQLFDSALTDGETLYKIDHVLPLAVIIPPISGVDKDEDAAVIELAEEFEEKMVEKGFDGLLIEYYKNGIQYGMFTLGSATAAMQNRTPDDPQNP